MKRYKFLRTGLKSENGNFKWKIGQWYKEDNIEMCERGFHCSKKIGEAFSYIQGEILAEVEVKGESEKKYDKEVWSEMKINKVWKWEKKNSVSIAIYSAELCLKNFEEAYPNDKRPREAIEAAKKWLEHPTKKNELAAKSAWSAAESAAWSAWSAKLAARSAAWSAWSAAWSAESAAKSAELAAKLAARSAESAAKSAAWSAVLNKIYKKFDEEFKKLKEYK